MDQIKTKVRNRIDIFKYLVIHSNGMFKVSFKLLIFLKTKYF